MNSPKLLWFYLVLAFGCIAILTITIRANFEFMDRVKKQCRDNVKQSQKPPKYKSTYIWNCIGAVCIGFMLLLIVIALYAEVHDESKQQDRWHHDRKTIRSCQ